MLLPFGDTVLFWGRFMIPTLMPGGVVVIYTVVGGIITFLCKMTYKEWQERLAKETIEREANK